VLVVEQSPWAQDGLARHLEYDEKVVANFEVRACRAADIETDEGRRLLRAASDVIVHVDADTPGRMLHLLDDLLRDSQVAPEHLTVIATGAASPSRLHERLRDTDLPPENLVVERERVTAARRLILQLTTRDSVPSTSLRRPRQ
jgi:hypothetical protein